ncbi:hypothetical protein TSUD_97300 [Trifolium subterraneum]|uniref:Uncharacterized protein n=1 Tax=Trifolium subterraneum TaxID=3900 RepID=A0A2Z6MDX2_TRISU|nr:hypothetical protein TSUD_97300 [Trifolium subterraneum]
MEGGGTHGGGSNGGQSHGGGAVIPVYAAGAANKNHQPPSHRGAADCLRENQFDRHANKDPWDHLSQFSEPCQIQKVPEYITEDQKQLRLFAFSLTS